jgi:hypothetical protein
VEQVGGLELHSFDSIERISDPARKNFENDVLSQFSRIVQQFEPPKDSSIPALNKNPLKQVSFEDAVRELLELSKKKQ